LDPRASRQIRRETQVTQAAPTITTINTAGTPPSFVKGLAFAVATLALSTWALGTLWLHAEAAEGRLASAGE
jgi:hypothetical protein